MKQRSLQAHSRRATLRNIIDSTLTVIYLGYFATSLLFSKYNTSSTIILTVATLILILLGWHNPPITPNERICILYRTGFVPLYASAYILAAWLYSMQERLIGESTLVTLASIVVATLIVIRVFSKRAEHIVLAASLVDGVIAGVLDGLEVLPLVFSLPTILVTASRPRILCDDRPLLYVLAIYSSTSLVVAYSILSLVGTTPLLRG